MNGFAKDILLIDFETTGLDLEKSKPIQLGAVLLDKEGLDEKDSFLSYIKQDISDMPEKIAKIHGITPKDLEDAPSPEEVIEKFLKKFGTNVFLASWNEMLDHTILRQMLEGVGKDIYEHDYHYLDIWPITYFYLVKQGKGDIIRSEPTFEYFGQGARVEHNALDDCRRTAEVLRKIFIEK